MKTRTTIALGIGFGILLASNIASAQEAKDTKSDAYQGSAPAHAVEITIGGGFGYAFGDYSRHRSMGDVASTGNVIQIGLGYRLNPHLLIGGYTEGGMYQPAEGSFGDRRNFSLAVGAQVQYHLLPYSRFDPWFGAGTGWRGYWMVDDEVGTTVMQGMDVVRAQVGVDIHFTPSFVLSPTVSGTLTHFIAESAPNETEYKGIEDSRPVSFFSAGLSGRFDIGGRRVQKAPAVARNER